MRYAVLALGRLVDNSRSSHQGLTRAGRDQHNMDKGKERGILKLDSRPKVSVESRLELTPQGSSELAPSSPQPSVDRLSVTWADPEPGSMASGVNLFHLPSEPVSEVKFSPSAGDGSEDEDYSASLSAVLRQRRASVRRSRKGRARRPSSPFLPDEPRPRRRSSVFTTSSGDTVVSMEEGRGQGQGHVTQEQIYENIHLHKEVLGSVKQQPLEMKRKLKLVHQAKAYIKRHQGQLQERLAQSKSTRDIYARFNILLTTKWQHMKREAANTSNLLIPWELRIKEIESHFGSVVASYFTFLRWLFWVNLVIAFVLLVFVIVPECLTANPQQDGERKIIMDDELGNASNLLTLWEFEGVLKFSPIFYGYYSNLERPEYRMPLAYFLTGLVVYIYSFVAILRKMAENSRMSKLSEKEDECIFSWKLFTGWDYMIGNTETAQNRIASVILGFKEALLEEAEKKKDVRNWRVISLRLLVNVCVVILLVISAYAVVTVVSLSDDDRHQTRSWWRENETTTVVTVISITFPVFFELLGFLEHYHPRKQLRLQLARIMLLNLLNLYSLIFALFSKIEGMSKDLDALKPTLSLNATTFPNSTLNITESLALNIPMECIEISISCAPCNLPTYISTNVTPDAISTFDKTSYLTTPNYHSTIKNVGSTNNVLPNKNLIRTTWTSTKIPNKLLPQNLEKYREIRTTTDNINRIQLEILKAKYLSSTVFEESSEEDDDSYSFDEITSASNSFETEYSSEITTPLINTENIYSPITQEHSYQTDNMNIINTDPADVTLPTSEKTLSIETETGSEATETQYETTPTEFEISESSEITETTTVSVPQSIFTGAPSLYTKEIILPYTDAMSTTSLQDEKETTYDYVEISSSNPAYIFNDTDITTMATLNVVTVCPDISFNCSVFCDGRNVTQVFFVSNCTLVEKKCYTKECRVIHVHKNTTMVDIVYEDQYKRRMYNLTRATKKKLLKLCWETMFGQELVKLTMMDLVFVLLGTLFMDFFRALFVRYMNRCWCWDLEKKFPEYGDFKIAENILHLINNQGMVWMGMFFSPGLVVLNVSKLMIMMYLRSWAVMTCNVPHEVVFRVSKSNNFYLALLLTMLFLCVLPVGYTIVWVKPSWHCGPFSEYDKIYYILTNNIYKILPKSLNFALEYVASPAIVIPLLVLLILIIYYLTSLTNSLREANNDLKIQLRRERTEERRKMFQLATDTRRRAGSSSIDTPFSRWKKALPALPLSKSIDSDDRKTISGEKTTEPVKAAKKRSGIFAKIVSLALDKKTEEPVSDEVPPSPNNVDDETDTDFHETLPREVLKIKDITILTRHQKKNNVEFKTEGEETKHKDNLKVNNKEDQSERRPGSPDTNETVLSKSETPNKKTEDRQLERKHTSDSTTSKQSDSCVIPVITISTTESDDEVLHPKKGKKKEKQGDNDKEECSSKKRKSNNSELKSLRRQSSVDSGNDQKIPREKKGEDGHKYQYSL